jgi:hypothetical protein
MPAYDYVILAAGWIAWMTPFFLIKRGGGKAERLDRRARWGIVLEGVAYSLLWQNRFWVRSPQGWRVGLSIVFLALAALLSWSSARTLGRQWRFDAGGGIHLRGTDGFRIDAVSDNSHLGQLCDPCQEGEFADVFARLIGDWFGTATIRGRDLEFDPFQPTNAVGQVDVGGGLLLPHLAGGPAQVSFPARISGNLQFRRFSEGDPFEIDVEFSASGIGTMSGRNINGVTFYDLPPIIAFDFGRSAVTPEPTSLILLGSGLGIGWWQRRRRAPVEA